MSAPQLRTHFDSDQSKRSWRTIKPANGNTMCDVSQVHDKPLSRDNCGWQFNHWRKNTGKKSVQRAAAVHLTIAVVVDCVAVVIIQVCLMIVDARSSRLGEGFGADTTPANWAITKSATSTRTKSFIARNQDISGLLYCASSL